MAHTKTVSAAGPRAGSTRTRVTPTGKSSVKQRRVGDRRTVTAEGRRAGAKPAAKKRPAGTNATEPPPIPTTPLTEEEQIESAKYLPRHVPLRVFEEERFLFPESYGIDRVRLLVKDPEWLFAYWDLSSRSVDKLRRELGERGMALARLTLRITDPGYGGTSIILLPYGARAWYVKADKARRSYRALLGWTLPSGQFRTLAESNLVTTPRVGPSPDAVYRRLPYTAPMAEIRAALGADAAANPGPWSTEPFDAEAPLGGRKRRGGASDAFRPPSAGKLGR
jgi:uncharacterized protein DUF4912